jgi:hypothetical protein
MATTRSDGKMTREELEREEELERIRRQRKNSERNQGRDPDERAISQAEILLTSQGFSAAKAGKNRGRVRDVVQRAAEAEPMTEAGRKRQERVLGQYDDFMRDADEFAGKPVGNYEPVKPRWKEREEAAEKAVAEVKAKGDKAFEKAKSEGWELYEEGSFPTGYKAGERAADGPDDEQLVTIQTPSGGSIVAKGKNISDNLYGSNRRDIDRAEAAEEFQQRLAERRRDRKFAEAEQLSSRLADKGIDQTPTKKDGTPDVDRMRGMLSAATFQEWDEADRMLAQGRAQQKSDRQRLRQVNIALREGGGRGGLMSNAERAALESEAANLRNATQYMNDEALRSYGRDSEQTRLAEIRKANEIAEAQRKQANALATKAESAGFVMSDQELSGMGLPSLSDDKAWEEALKNNPMLEPLYKALKSSKKISRTGRTMADALTALT